MSVIIILHRKLGDKKMELLLEQCQGLIETQYFKLKTQNRNLCFYWTLEDKYDLCKALKVPMCDVF